MRLFWCLLASLFLAFSAQAAKSNFYKIDNRAKNTPVIYSETKEQLVQYLTKGLATDEEKARAIAAWMVFQIDKNGYEERKMETASSKRFVASAPLGSSIFESRVGTSKEYAELFAELGKMAGLTVEIIEGFRGEKIYRTSAKNPYEKFYNTELFYNRDSDLKLQKFRGFWNAVKIKDGWMLLDVYQMADFPPVASKIRKEAEMYSFLKKRMRERKSVAGLTKRKRLDDDFFFPEPKKFVETHFPDEEKWQLLNPPVTWVQFTK